MTTLLNIVIGIQVLLGLWWTVPLLFHDGTFSTLYVFFLSAIANGAFLLVAAWAMWKHPQLRRRAAIVMALPFALYLLPFLLKFIAGGPFTGERGLSAVAVLAVALLGSCIFFPQRVFRLLPRGLVRSRFLNWLIIIGMVAAWLVPIALIIWIAAGDSGGSSSGTAVAYAIYYFALYTVAVGAGALLIMAWGWIGVRGDRDNPSRNLHIAQLVMGSPSLVIGLLTMSWLASQQ